MKKSVSLIIVVILFFSACYKKTIKNKVYEDLDETIVYFMLKEDDKSLIVIGEKYHYIFEADKNLEYLLNNTKEDFKFDIENGSYTLNEKVFANFDIKINKEKSSKKFIIWAYENGAKDYNNKEKEFKLKISLKGDYFLSNEEINKSMQKLEDNLHIKIRQSKTVNKEIEVSPIKEVTKGVFVIVGVSVTAAIIAIGAIIAIPFYLVSKLFSK